jgi:hypothetical protein
MARIVRHEFLGSTLGFWLLCMTGIGIPLAVVYLLCMTVRIEEDIDNPAEFIEKFRMGELGR